MSSAQPTGEEKGATEVAVSDEWQYILPVDRDDDWYEEILSNARILIDFSKKHASSLKNIFPSTAHGTIQAFHFFWYERSPYIFVDDIGSYK